MASPRLSSSRNCENSGANLMVSFCALRRFHHFPIDTESDQTDMNSSTAHRNFPKNGVCAQMLAKSRFKTQLHHGWGKWGLLRDREREGLLHQLTDFLGSHFGRNEPHAWKRVFHCRGEKLVRGANHLERRQVSAASGVDDERHERLTFDAGLAEDVRILRRRRIRRLHDRLLDLELEIRVVFADRSLLHAGGEPTSGALAGEIGLV